LKTSKHIRGLAVGAYIKKLEKQWFQPFAIGVKKSISTWSCGWFFCWR